MTYEQLNGEERSELAGLRRLGLSQAEMGRQLGRHRRTVGRELKRHAAPYKGWVSGGASGAGPGRKAVEKGVESRVGVRVSSAQWGALDQP